MSSVPEAIGHAALELAQRVGEDAVELLLKALLGHRDPVDAVSKATIQALSKQAYRRPDLAGKK